MDKLVLVGYEQGLDKTKAIAQEQRLKTWNKNHIFVICTLQTLLMLIWQHIFVFIMTHQETSPMLLSETHQQTLTMLHNQKALLTNNYSSFIMLVILTTVLYAMQPNSSLPLKIVFVATTRPSSTTSMLSANFGNFCFHPGVLLSYRSTMGCLTNCIPIPRSTGIAPKKSSPWNTLLKTHAIKSPFQNC